MNTQSEGNPPSASKLREAMRNARVAQSVRNDVIVDLRETELARLEVLADALAPVFAEVPIEAEQFECSLVPGSTPRLWIDMLTFVDMGRDKRTYRFVSDTRSGRQVMLETTNVASLTERITNYIAHRLVERERSLISRPGTGGGAENWGDISSQDVSSRNVSGQNISGQNLGAADVNPAPGGGNAFQIESNSGGRTAGTKSTSWREGTQIGIAYIAGILMGASLVILLALYVTS